MLRLAAGEMRSQITARQTSDRGSPKLRAGMLYILYCLSYFNIGPLGVQRSHVFGAEQGFVGTCRGEADRGSNSDRIPNSSLPKDPGKKVAAKERGPKCQCCKQYHK